MVDDVLFGEYLKAKKEYEDVGVIGHPEYKNICLWLKDHGYTDGSKMVTMWTLSVQQPWPWAMFNAGKDIENRDWPTDIRGEVLIHAGKTIDRDGISFLRGMGLIVPENLPIGGIVGKVNITDCVTESQSKWFFGKYGYVLKDQKELPFFACKGQLRFYKTDYLWRS